MAAKDSLLSVRNNGSERHLIEHVVDLGENAILIVDIFAQFLSAFLSESHVLIHVPILVIASEENNLPWILQLQSEE